MTRKKKLIICIAAAVLVVLIALSAVVTVVLVNKNKSTETSNSSLDASSASQVETVSSEPEISDDTVSQVTSSVIEIAPEKNNTISGTSELKKQADAVTRTESNTVKVSINKIDASGLKSKSVKLPVNYLAQNPELPTGCEITALTTVLNYYGFSVSKTQMADNYLAKQEVPANFWNVFLGNPRRTNSFGCYAQPITDAANKYLTEQNADYRAYNRSGWRFEKLLSEVENGRPVVIWGTMKMSKPYYTVKWTVDGQTIQWIAPEHCLVLIGYDIDKNVAIMSDPQYGIVEYSLTTVKERYIALHSQCVVIEKLSTESTPPVSSTTPPSSSEEETSSNSSVDSSGEPSKDTSSEAGSNSTESNSSENSSSDIEPPKENDSSAETTTQ